MQLFDQGNNTPKHFRQPLPFYVRNWFTTILILAYPFTYFISAIFAFGLILYRSKRFPTLTHAEYKKYQDFESAKTSAENILSQANAEKESIIKSAETQKTDIVSGAEKKKEEIISEAEKSQKTLQETIEKLETEKRDLEQALSERADALLLAQTTVDFSDTITSNEIKNELSLIQLTEKELIKSGKAIKASYNESKSVLNKQSKQILRAFNAEADYYISSVTVKNVDNYRNKLAKAFETLNSLFDVDGVKITQDYLTSKLKQLDVLYKYQKQVEIEKELLKAQKEEIKEQQKAEKEIQDAKRKLEKEEQQFNNEMSKLLKYLNGANNDIEQQIYADKIKELEEKIKLLEKDKQNVLERESNTRAGYVYIISNIGSFGEDIYKIGMTRRLEPMDRIAELSSASVPFPFDVHALIFAEDAPALENTLHKYFREHEVNKLNPRKEFFKVNLDEIKKIVHEKHNNTVHFTDLAVAEQYYESLKLSEK